ncbi:putative quinol monooxygenase [Propionibacteriaceae bacterium G1746]|uniref:putative quinol monooxygenase n=1 Tax=Aestuariimicrobium sp. G57 TaxID=3418485 RepID=UPI003C23C319
MYSIVVKFKSKPEFTESWPEIVRPFTEATRAEPGNLFFEWSRSVEEPDTWVLIEAFTDEGAGPHVNSDHFKAGLDAMRPCIVETPKIISRQVEGNGWDEMGELKI